MTFLGQRPQSYVLQLSGNPGLLPNGQVAWLGDFASTTGGAVYFVPNTGEANPPRIRLGPVTNISAPPNDPLNYQGTISLPVAFLPSTTDSQRVIGNLVFEISGLVLQTVPLYWPTTDVKVNAITPLPEWDPLQPTRAASIIAGTAPQPVEFEFELEFRGCPPLDLRMATIWDNASQVAIVSPHARSDRMDSGPKALPGKATIWIKEADLYHPPLRSPTDGILFEPTATDGSQPYIPVRKPFTITQPPGSIDLASRQCSYQIDVGYTGGYKILRVVAYEQKRFTGFYGPPAILQQWTIHRQALLGGAVLQMNIPSIRGNPTGRHPLVEPGVGDDHSGGVSSLRGRAHYPDRCPQCPEPALGFRSIGLVSMSAASAHAAARSRRGGPSSLSSHGGCLKKLPVNATELGNTTVRLWPWLLGAPRAAGV